MTAASINWPSRPALCCGGLLAVMLGLSACAGAPQRSSSDIAALTACRHRADEVYAKQNRAEVYMSDTFATSGRDSPYSTTALPGVTTRGLSGQYERDSMVSDCLAGTGPATGVSTSPKPRPPASAPAAPLP